MNIAKVIYRVIRGILFTAIIFVAVSYLLLYILLSVPSFRESLKYHAEKEVSLLLDAKVEIEDIDIHPFNEVMVRGLSVYDRKGEKCLSVNTLGAGIRLWRLLKEKRIELTYAEVIGLDANIYQESPDSALNIQFIIDAFKPKDKNKPPTKFDLELKNVVLRKCSASFNKRWIPESENRLKTDFNHLYLSDLKADINLPKISNEDYVIDLRRLAFNLSGGLRVETIAFRAHLTPTSLSLADIVVKLPVTELRPADFVVSFDAINKIPEAIKSGNHHLIMIDNTVDVSDFSWLIPDLKRFQIPCLLSIDAEGNANSFRLNEFKFSSEGSDLSVSLSGRGDNVLEKDSSEFEIEELNVVASEAFVAEILSKMPDFSKKGSDILSKCGNLNVSASGRFIPGRGYVDVDSKIAASCGTVYLECTGRGLRQGSGVLKGEVIAEELDGGIISGHDKLGLISGNVAFSGSLRGKDADGEMNAEISSLEYNGITYDEISAGFVKTGKEISGNLNVGNSLADAEIIASATMAGAESVYVVDADVRRLNLTDLGLLPQYQGYVVSGNIGAEINGNNADNMHGMVIVSDALFGAKGKKSIFLEQLVVSSDIREKEREIKVESDWLDVDLKGDFRLSELIPELRCMASKVIPSLVTCPDFKGELASDAGFSFRVKADNTLTEFFNLPIRLLVDITGEGFVDATSNKSRLNVRVPYLQQGKDKLIHDSKLEVEMDGETGTGRLFATSVYPAKKGDLLIGVNIMAQDDNVFTDFNWETPGNSATGGNLSLDAELSRNELSNIPEVNMDINPSGFNFGSAKWNIGEGNITYKDGVLDVRDFKIWHDRQFVDIEGRASKDDTDSISVRLADIDLGYIFETLNINYVSFGGIATGDITAYGALGKTPVASTDNLNVKSFSYNGAELGDGIIKSYWDNAEKKVAISADISGKENNKSIIDGGIWVTRDSLSFEIDADRVPVDFLGPFMSAFTSDVKGKASGKAKLFGTFSDIDLTGRIHADSLAIKLDYTNVYYHGSDSVILDPGKIIIPSFRIYDKEGNSAILTGELTHRYFHEPRFNFRISDVRGMLCYDTNSKINPDWYGTVYGNGHAVVKGWPGTVSISVDMTAVKNSRFTLVLNETQAAEDYHFLTFSDKRKEEAEKLRADSISPILASFRKQIKQENSNPSTFRIDIRSSISPSTLMTLVMDPVAGDKITARGNGNLQIDYDSETDQLQMLGKYILEEGNYNFSLQDLILKDFTIRQGSSISFNGDPYNAQLDISAAYRVNTNLSDLDKSFTTDRDLARTNVPVDAMLMVKGELQHPDITFDIELPTLTQDVERKVKSIISTDDMMSRQIIYLLALNRFYTPEYMGTSSNGGEWAAVASSTLSSQLSNMIGQLTDKFTLSPSFRSDKGDFSDIEVDVALSSRLLNNRLLVNGNFGYRDRATSTTTFVGDFDIEYLLSRSGNLRLKAYNHFNDQNYYLRQALTTQGLGFIYRRDFDNPFTFLKGISSFFKKKKDKNNDAGSGDKDTDRHESEGDSVDHNKDVIEKLK